MDDKKSYDNTMSDNDEKQSHPDNPFGGLGEMLKSAMTGMQAGPGGEKKEWWHSFRYPETPDFSIDKLMNCARSALFGEALGGGAAVQECSYLEYSNSVPIKETVLRVVRYVGDFGKLVYHHHDDEYPKLFFVFSGGAISVALCPFSGKAGSEVTVKVVGTTKAHMQLGKDLLDACVKEKYVKVEA